MNAEYVALTDKCHLLENQLELANQRIATLIKGSDDLRRMLEDARKDINTTEAALGISGMYAKLEQDRDDLRRQLAYMQRQRDMVLSMLVENVTFTDEQLKEAGLGVGLNIEIRHDLPLERKANADLRRQVDELIKESRESRDGNWIDKFGACKVCDGEIPDGHMDNCDIYKLEIQITKLRAENAELKRNVAELKRMFEFVAQFTKTNSFVIPRGHNPVKEILWAMESKPAATPEEYVNFTRIP